MEFLLLMKKMIKYSLTYQLSVSRTVTIKPYLVRVALPDVSDVGRCEPCGGKRPPCQLCSHMKNANTFKNKHSNEICQLNNTFNCNSKIMIYLIDCLACGEQYNDSTATKLRARANNFKSTHRNFQKEQKLLN